MTRADEIEIDFELETGEVLTASLPRRPGGAKVPWALPRPQPDMANLPAGEVYFVPTGAEGDFP